MARNTTGYLHKRGGVYQIEYVINGKRIKRSLETGNRREAEKLCKEILSPIQAINQRDKMVGIKAAISAKEDEINVTNDFTIDKAWDVFIKGNTRAESTTKNYKNSWSTFTTWLSKYHPEASMVSQISQQMAISYGESLGEKNIAPRTYNRHIQALSHLTKRLHLKAGIDSTNPWQFVQLRSLDTQSKKEFSEKQLTSIFNKLADPDYELQDRLEWEVVYHLGAYTGLRLIDCIKFKWEFVNFETRQISLIPVKTKRLMKRVSIPIHPSLYAMLAKYKPSESVDLEFVSPHLSERYDRNQSGVCRSAVTIIEDCDIKVREKTKRKNRQIAVSQYGFHSLRHSFVSFCANAGVPLAVVQSIVGHSSPAITNHYSHISNEAAKQAVLSIPNMGSNNDPEPDLQSAIDLLKNANENNWQDLTKKVCKILDGIASTQFNNE
ncbi:MAG: site-specific integrase [Lentisphaeria bacterium]|nr:site-specific integrase [Lentisphaeria bacterium]NQZ70089.1 site-specific integrase [Lentisphaeria bacterium]